MKPKPDKTLVFQSLSLGFPFLDMVLTSQGLCLNHHNEIWTLLRLVVVLHSILRMSTFFWINVHILSILSRILCKSRLLLGVSNYGCLYVLILISTGAIWPSVSKSKGATYSTRSTYSNDRPEQLRWYFLSLMKKMET